MTDERSCIFSFGDFPPEKPKDHGTKQAINLTQHELNFICAGQDTISINSALKCFDWIEATVGHIHFFKCSCL